MLALSIDALQIRSGAKGFNHSLPYVMSISSALALFSHRKMAMRQIVPKTCLTAKKKILLLIEETSAMDSNLNSDQVMHRQ